MSDTPYAIPLIELLKDVPIDGSDCYPISSVHHKNIPYGELCHAAAKEIEQLEQERDEAREALLNLSALVRRLFALLETVEVSDSEREFHPTYISSCRVAHTMELDKLLPKLKEAAK